MGRGAGADDFGRRTHTGCGETVGRVRFRRDEPALRHQGDAFRVVNALQIGDEIWVIHAFQEKSTFGIKTAKADIDLIHARLKRLREWLG
jgi:phage-related protein